MAKLGCQCKVCREWEVSFAQTPHVYANPFEEWGYGSGREAQFYSDMAVMFKAVDHYNPRHVPIVLDLDTIVYHNWYDPTMPKRVREVIVYGMWGGP